MRVLFFVKIYKSITAPTVELLVSSTKIALPVELFFSKASGSGIISCNKCFYSESILGFIHSYDFSNGNRCGTEGFQCQTCGKFHTIKSYEHENYVLKNCDCGGNISRKEFIFCPKCKSDDIEYQNKYLT